jgi:inorganic triphosphatase YgiF
MEVEAKFFLKNPLALRSLGRIKTLGPFHLMESRHEDQINVYWDTADLTLKRVRAALKLRRIGSSACVTFKQHKSQRHGVFHREEITYHLKPNPLGWLDPGGILRLNCPPIRLARAIAGSKPFEEVLTLKTKRHRRLFAIALRDGRLDGSERIEVDLDRVSVWVDGHRVACFDEIEVENLSAGPQAFYQALEALRQRFGPVLQLKRHSKYETGLRLKKQALS